MKIRLSITSKLFLGFGVILIAVFFTSFYIFNTLNEHTKVNDRINKVYTPTLIHLNELYEQIANTRLLIKIWVYADQRSDTPDKNRLKEIHSNDYNQLKAKLDDFMTGYWDSEAEDKYKYTCKQIDTLFKMQKEVMEILNTDQSYDGYDLLLSKYKVDEGGDINAQANKILTNINTLKVIQNKNIEEQFMTMFTSISDFRRIIVLMGVILVISVIIIAYVLNRTLVIPINYIRNIIQKMGQGILPNKVIKSGNDEIGDMAQALNGLINGLKETSEFSIIIGKGDFNSEFRPLSEHDVLGNSLIKMRENLKEASKADEQRKLDNYRRTWASQGIAKFGEILRKNNDDIEEFAYSIISNLVKYLGAKAGGFFVLTEHDKDSSDDIEIELIASYAYTRRKYLHSKIKVGVTVIGQCVKEKEKIYMTDIPKDYIHIASGLGEDNPRSLLVVPLITNEEVFGVVEIASFDEIEPYQIEFVEKVGENIAATILSVQINNKTAKLLSESQEKSERLARQEEEMRQNIEEMRASQEDMMRKDSEKYARIKQDYEDQIELLKGKIEDVQKELIKRDRDKDITKNKYNFIDY